MILSERELKLYTELERLSYNMMTLKVDIAEVFDGAAADEVSDGVFDSIFRVVKMIDGARRNISAFNSRLMTEVRK